MKPRRWSSANSLYGKTSKKALLRWCSTPRRTGTTQPKGGENRLKFIKAIMILAVLAGALSLGACAQHKEAAAPAPTTGYHKKLAAVARASSPWRRQSGFGPSAGRRCHDGLQRGQVALAAWPFPI